MLSKLTIAGIIAISLSVHLCHAQSVDSLTGKVARFPSRWLQRIGSSTSSLNRQLTDETSSCLQKMARREEKMRQRLAAVDPAAAHRLFDGVAERYAVLTQQIKKDTGSRGQGFSGQYPAYLDSLKGSVAFLQEHPDLLSSAKGASGQLQATSLSLQAIQARMNDADGAKAFIQQRQQMLSQYLAQHSQFASVLQKPIAGMKQEAYYYSQQLRAYKEMWTNPDQLQQRALSLLNRLPAYQTFMKGNSMLGGLFHLPSSYSTPQAVSGLQTKAQVADLVHGQVSAGGAGGDAALQGSLQSAQDQLNDYKGKLSRLGSGNGDMPLPNFKPNDQKTKTFWRRLEYGVNIQTTRTGYYFPTVTDFGFSLGYRLGHDNLVGLGASYKLGWGNGINHIVLSSQGVGLRSYLQIKIKGSFSASGGFEYNYTTPFTSYQQLRELQYWTKSGLIGVTKTVSMKNRVFRKTSVSLLWDFLSYQQLPKTQPFLFRIGYNF